MTTTITAAEVFEFATTQTADRTTAKSTMVQAIIDRTIPLIEDHIGRYVYPRLETIKVHNGRYADIVGNKLWLSNKYYDIAELTSITEDGDALVNETDYILTNPNIIERIDSYWSGLNQLNIVIVAWFGLGTVTPVDGETAAFGVIYPPLKEIIIEAVAILAGLWGRVVDTGEGQYTITKSNLPKLTVDALKAYRQIAVL